ncbi:TonB-dependent receptor [Sphingomonas sp. R-74633]|uniref:TonB-dependent receptor n=1 Tax=Sphingomonas sp. R-74633 TaxID=2751188 RepID=UPI0015D2C468|nr:TonB-dependent receptor [Sphingomonas sp. R-74633]NYT41447.1 TonB-dependent receptor [Sphingomonas sp. R-74633]
MMILPASRVPARRGRTILRRALPAALLLTAQAPVSSAIAQTADPDEIIVTARKREEESLRVPVVATVIRADELDRRQVTDLYAIAAMTPGLVLGAAPLEVGTEVSLRGVGSSPLDPGVDQSVALNLDGLPLGQGAAYSVGLFDMARVEVLKGPQPLFFGKNSPGGVIAIRTADPGDATDVSASAGYEAEAREWQTRLILSGPVTETLGLRLSTQYASRDGYFRNTAIALPDSGARQPAARFGSGHSLYLRLTGLFRPSADFTARLKLNVTQDRSLGGLGEQLTYCPDGTYNYLPAIGLNLPSEYSANESCRVDRNLNIVDMDPAAYPGVPNGGVSFTENGQRFGTLEMNWAVAPHLMLTSVTGYYRLKVDALQNGPWSGGAAPPLALTKALRREEATQEVRLTSDFGGALDFTAGAFFQDASIRNDISFLGNSRYGLPAIVVQGTHDIAIRSYALFGQARVRPTTRLEIAGGVRWTDEKRSDTPTTYDVFGVFSGVQGATLHPQVPRLRSRNWSPELTISWFPTTDLTVFGSVKQGYKSGSYNINQALTPGDDNSFGDERGRGGEAGVKGYAGARQFYFELAGYHYQYSGLQAGIIRINSAGIPTLATVNAGAAKVYGVDLALRYAPRAIAGLKVSAAANWNRGHFTRFINADCKAGQTVSEGCNLLPTLVTDPGELAAGYYSIDPALGVPVRYNGQDLSGTPLHRAPAWQGNFGVDYDSALSGKLALGLGGQIQYSSRYVVDLGNRDHGWQEAFAKLSASIRLRARDERWEVALIGNNLTDRLTTGGCLTINYPGGGGVFPGIITGAPIKGLAGSGETVCAYERGRELWLRLTLRPFRK